MKETNIIALNWVNSRGIELQRRFLLFGDV